MHDLTGTHKGRSVHLLVLAGLVGVFFSRVLLTGRTLLLPDLSLYFYPAYVYYRQCLLEGTLPLWNPFSGCGEPFLAEIERAVFYPPNLVYLIVPSAFAVTVYAAFHVLLAGAGAYGLCRTWRVSQLGSLLAGVLFAFNSFTITRVEFPSALASTAWYPIVLGTFSRWVRTPELRRLLWFAGAIFLQCLAGYPEITLFTVVSLTLYALMAGYHEWRKDGRWLRLFRPLVGMIAAGVIAVLLALAQLLPTWEAGHLSLKREEFGKEALSAVRCIHPTMLLSFLIPSVHGTHGRAGRYWAPSCAQYQEGAMYVGVLPWVVFSMALFLRLQSRRPPVRPVEGNDTVVRIRVPFLIALGGVFLLHVMGRYSPPFRWLWHAVSFVRMFWCPTKSLVCVVFTLSCLSGIGMDWLLNRAEPNPEGQPRWRVLAARWGAPSLWLVLSLFVLACLVNDGRLGETLLRRCFNLNSVEGRWTHRIPWDVLRIDSLKLPVVAMVSVVLLHVCIFAPLRFRGVAWLAPFIAFADLAITNCRLLVPGRTDVLDKPSAYLNRLTGKEQPVRFYLAKRPINFVYGETSEQIYRLCRDVLLWSWPMADRAFGLESAGIFEPAEVTELVQGLLRNPNVSADMKRRLLEMLNCEHIVFFPDMDTYWSEGVLETPRFTPVGHPLPRAYVVGGVNVLPNKQAVFSALVWPEYDPLTVVVTDRQSAGNERFGDLQPGRVRHRVTALTYEANRLHVEVESERSGLLVISDAYYPDWQATVNGRPTPIWRVNGALRGLRVQAGVNKVTMVYRPRSLRIGMVGSAAAMVLFGVAVCWSWYGPRRRSLRAPGGGT